MRGCPQLRRVSLQPLATMKNAFVQVVMRQWQAMCPGLAVGEGCALQRPVWETA